MREYPSPAASRTPPPEPAATPLPDRQPPSSRWALIFGGSVSGLTVLAILLAALAPMLLPAATLPAHLGWAQVYSADLHLPDSRWDTHHGCTFTSVGLLTTNDGSPAVCTFKPSQSEDLTSKGFFAQVTLAPAAKVPGQEGATLFMDGESLVSIDQNGQYVICADACAPNGSNLLSGQTIAWHSSPLIANTLAAEYTPTDQALTIYVNGQRITETKVALSPQPAFAIGATANLQAAFTHVTLYSGSASHL